VALKDLGRQALHAWKLGFQHPVSGEMMSFASELPEDMAKLLDALRAGN
jgi:23S rRNA pseudouridine1911/1915/1917 synthase